MSDTLRALHGDVLGALGSAVPDAVSVCYAGLDISSRQLSGSVRFDGESIPVPSCCLQRLACRGEDPGGQTGVTRWVVDSIRAAAEEAGCSGLTQLTSVRFEKAGRFLGLGAVLQRKCEADALRVELERIAPTLSSLVASYERCAELERQVAVRCAMPRSAAICAVNLVRGRVICSYGFDLAAHPVRDELESALVALALRIEHTPAARHEPVHLGGLGKFAEATDLHALWRPCEARTFALGFEPDVAPTEGDDAERLRCLSNRERQIAVLLASGYAALNIAAILQLSEHTIRTYIRRLYRKWEVSNRADFARQFFRYSTAAAGESPWVGQLVD